MSRLSTRSGNKLSIDSVHDEFPVTRNYFGDLGNDIHSTMRTIVGERGPTSTLRSRSSSCSRLSFSQRESPGNLSPLSLSAALGHGRSSFFNYVTHAYMIDPESGREVALKRRDEVGGIIRKLERLVAKPIVEHFELSYHMLGEHHPNAGKAGITHREKVLPDGRFRWSIRLRIRSRTSPMDSMLSHGTHVAVLLHELAHLRWMNHGRDFALFLRDIYRFADTTLELFRKPLVNDLPSPWEWERQIWTTKGNISDAELICIHQEWQDTCNS